MRSNRLPQSSQTDEIDRGSGPILAFLQHHFPSVPQLALAASTELKNCETVRPLEKIRYTLVGTAVEYYLRAMLPGFQLKGTLAHAGLLAEQRYSEGSDYELACSDFADEFPNLLQRGRSNPEMLAQITLALALFNDIARCSARGFPFPYPEWQALLVWPDAEVHEVAAIGQRAYELMRDLDPVNACSPILGNAVMGADADLILGTCLFDMKVTIEPCGPAKWSRNLYQLLGYVLLDVHDKYGIDSIAVLLPRQGRIMTWPLSTFISTKEDLRHLRLGYVKAQQVLARYVLNWPSEAVAKLSSELTAVP